MGLWKETTCPLCRKDGAVKLLWMVRCTHKGCPNYHYSYAQTVQTVREELDNESDELIGQADVPLDAWSQPGNQFTGSFQPEAAVTIRYTNHQGSHCEFITDWRTLISKGRHLSACLAPTGTRCAFDKRKIHNLDDLKPYFSRISSLRKVEQRILASYLTQGIDNPRVHSILEKIG